MPPSTAGRVVQPLFGSRHLGAGMPLILPRPGCAPVVGLLVPSPPCMARRIVPISRGFQVPWNALKASTPRCSLVMLTGIKRTSAFCRLLGLALSTFLPLLVVRPVPPVCCPTCVRLRRRPVRLLPCLAFRTTLLPCGRCSRFLFARKRLPASSVARSTLPCVTPRRKSLIVLRFAVMVDVANCLSCSLEDSLSNWHARAEKVFKQAVSLGVVACKNSAERCKGAPVTTRPALPKPLVSRNEPVTLRRLRRLHRAVVEEWRRGPGAPLTAVQNRHWSVAFRDKLFPVSASWPSNQAEALTLVSQAITSAERDLSDASHASWRQAFQRWDVRAIKAVKAVLKPSPPPGTQTAQNLCNSWKPLFCTPDPPTAGFGEAWVSFANRSGLAPREPATDTPALQDFLDAVSNARGAPGLDGWTHFELKWLSRHVPGLLQELFCILRDATFGTQSLSGPAWLTLLSWRLAAVPKREADEHRPVAVGSTILRVWQKTLLRLLPDLPSRQLGGRSGTSVSNTIGDWLSHRGLFGAEIDLAKAFDNVSWAAASASLRHQGVSPAIIRFLSHVWSGPRFCSLHGTLSSAFYGSRHSAG